MCFHTLLLFFRQLMIINMSYNGICNNSECYYYKKANYELIDEIVILDKVVHNKDFFDFLHFVINNKRIDKMIIDGNYVLVDGFCLTETYSIRNFSNFSLTNIKFVNQSSGIFDIVGSKYVTFSNITIFESYFNSRKSFFSISESELVINNISIIRSGFNGNGFIKTFNSSVNIDLINVSGCFSFNSGNIPLFYFEMSDVVLSSGFIKNNNFHSSSLIYSYHSYMLTLDKFDIYNNKFYSLVDVQECYNFSFGNSMTDENSGAFIKSSKVKHLSILNSKIVKYSSPSYALINITESGAMIKKIVLEGNFGSFILAVYSGRNINIENTNFSKNKAIKSLFHIDNHSHTTIIETEFNESHSYESIFLVNKDSKLVINDSIFINNYAVPVISVSSSLNVSNSFFEDNHAKIPSSIISRSGNIVLFNSKFRDLSEKSIVFKNNYFVSFSNLTFKVSQKGSHFHHLCRNCEYESIIHSKEEVFSKWTLTLTLLCIMIVLLALHLLINKHLHYMKNMMQYTQLR